MISVPMTLFTFLFGGVATLIYYLAGRRAMRHTQVWISSTGHIAIEQITEIFNNLKYIRAAKLPHAAGHPRDGTNAYVTYRDSHL